MLLLRASLGQLPTRGESTCAVQPITEAERLGGLLRGPWALRPRRVRKGEAGWAW
jgi:hypothetical protein